MKKSYLIISIALVVFTACNSSKKETSKISGAGATFPAPFYNIVFKNYSQKSGNDVTYGGIGSGGGIRSLQDKTVDFGATDVFLSDNEMNEMSAEVVHIPTALGAVVMAYNLPGVDDLKLTARLISDIYRGKITKWDDDAIKAVNPELNLPNKTITAVYRSDGSGTTYVFSDYMVKADELWKSEIGSGKALNFPVGVAAKGNPGVAGIIAQTEGSIGYIGSEYALALKIPSAALQNSSGSFIEANSKSISVAASIELPADTRIMITNSPVPEAYPISTFTWVILYREQSYNKRTEVNAKALIGLMDYVISEEGQQIAEKTHYAPLPPAALEKTKAILETITYNNIAISTQPVDTDER